MALVSLTTCLAACGGGGDNKAGDNAFTSVRYPNIYASLMVDVDNDGKVDLVTGGPNSADQVQRGTGVGTFQTASFLPPHYQGTSGQTVFFAPIDANEDGKADLISVTVDGRQSTFYQSARIQLFINDGTGHFVDGSSGLPNGGNMTGWADAVHVVDLDGDGHLDLVLNIGLSNTSNIAQGTVWRGDGAGHFVATSVSLRQTVGATLYTDTKTTIDAPSTTPRHPAPSQFNLVLAVGDVDNDGKPDVVSLARHFTYLNKSTPGSMVFEAVDWETTMGTTFPYQGALVDYTGDGLLDIVGSEGIASSSSTSRPVTAWRNAGGGVFQTDTSAVPSTVGLQHGRQWLVADFDGDGRKDIYIADHGWDASPFPGYPNTLLRNNGNGTFSNASAGLSRKRTFTHGASMADVNGDGRIDIFENNTWTGGTAEKDAYLFINGGGMTFVPQL
jgi:hypothetical protein